MSNDEKAMSLNMSGYEMGDEVLKDFVMMWKREVVRIRLSETARMRRKSWRGVMDLKMSSVRS